MSKQVLALLFHVNVNSIKNTLCESFYTKTLLWFILLKDLATSNNNNLPQAQRYNLHALVASLLILLPHIVAITPLKDYSEKVHSCLVKVRDIIVFLMTT